jgi:hypothetical protein
MDTTMPECHATIQGANSTEFKEVPKTFTTAGATHSRLEQSSSITRCNCRFGM